MVNAYSRISDDDASSFIPSHSPKKNPIYYDKGTHSINFYGKKFRPKQSGKNLTSEQCEELVKLLKKSSQKDQFSLLSRKPHFSLILTGLQSSRSLTRKRNQESEEEVKERRSSDKTELVLKGEKYDKFANSVLKSNKITFNKEKAQLDYLGHKVSPKMSKKKMLLTITKVIFATPIALVGLLIFLPFTPFFYAKYLSDKAKSKKINNPLAKDVLAGKLIEESEKYIALQKAAAANKVENIRSLKIIDPIKVVRNKFERILTRLEANHQITSNEKSTYQRAFKKIKGKDAHSLLENFKKSSLFKQLNQLDFDWEQFATELSVYDNDDQDISDFNYSINVLQKLASKKLPSSTSLEDYTLHNREILNCLRIALNSPFYQAYKEDLQDPRIKLLHNMCAAIWNGPKALKGFARFGEKLIQKSEEDIPNRRKSLSQPISFNPGRMLEEDEKETEESVPKARDEVEHAVLSGAKVTEVINTSIKTVRASLFNYSSIVDKIQYAWFNRKQALGSLRSTAGLMGNVAGKLGSGRYDSAMLSNNPSLQGTSKFQIKGNDVQINCVYGGTPTLDSDISPEYLGVLQAVENNRIAVGTRDYLESIPNYVTYINLQHISHVGGEGQRSIALMRLNHRFPLSFTGVTLTKDSKFFRRPCKKSSDWDYASKFGRRMKSELLRAWDPVILGKKGCGYYFPGKKEDWTPVFDIAIKQANIVFDSKYANNIDDANKLAQAYQELIHSLLQNYVEINAAQRLIAEGVTNPLIQGHCACKEDIDRGGTAKVKQLYNQSPKIQKKQKEELMPSIVGTLNGRPLFFRNRTILPHRVQPFLNYCQYVSLEQYQVALEGMFKKDGIQTKNMSYKLAL